MYSRGRHGQSAGRAIAERGWLAQGLNGAMEIAEDRYLRHLKCLLNVAASVNQSNAVLPFG